MFELWKNELKVSNRKSAERKGSRTGSHIGELENCGLNRPPIPHPISQIDH